VLDALLNAPVNSGQVCNGKAPRIKLAAAFRAAAAHLGSCNASTELLAIAAELDPTP